MVDERTLRKEKYAPQSEHTKGQKTEEQTHHRPPRPHLCPHLTPPSHVPCPSYRLSSWNSKFVAHSRQKSVGRQFDGPPLGPKFEDPVGVLKLEGHTSGPALNNPPLDPAPNPPVDPTPKLTPDPDGTISTPPTPPPNGTFSRVLKPRFAPISGPRSIFRVKVDDDGVFPFKPFVLKLAPPFPLVLVGFAFIWIPRPTALRPYSCPQFSLSELDPSPESAFPACLAPFPFIIPMPIPFVVSAPFIAPAPTPFSPTPVPFIGCSDARVTLDASSSPSTYCAMTFNTQSLARAPHAHVVNVELRAWRIEVICARR
ncbi:uncharacterized protein BJ212DRAFT_768874 [Suillus subaureus]|uniref:Uncharacterized protein n=1 Tax=Suillus subaureus TaxID=48587 RepID=A0A9P7E030_9AGAM|nr:uncharacterized protein BJ212DRAFT_768874 [Suillus subaureus]KAG1807174.1 hypothetical protein BJ212DRAFT_768874 [Suillus subaureus]